MRSNVVYLTCKRETARTRSWEERERKRTRELAVWMGKLARKGQITRDGGVPPRGSVDSENSKARAREQTEAVNETKLKIGLFPPAWAYGARLRDIEVAGRALLGDDREC